MKSKWVKKLLIALTITTCCVSAVIPSYYTNPKDTSMTITLQSHGAGT